MFRAAEDAEASFMTVFKDAAKAHKGKMLFSYSGVSEGIQERLAEFVGVTAADLPTLRALQPADMKKFMWDGDLKSLTVDGVGKWIDDVVAGRAAAHLKSEEPPAEQGDVTVIVGKEFNKIVKDNTKDVLVKYYAPWCGHCKKLAPVWEELATAYKDEPNLVIGKFDATANEADGVQIQGYPTLIFYPKDNKEGVKFEGERDLESIKKWLADNSAVLKSQGANEDL
jgi:protein disulfide isomerase